MPDSSTANSWLRDVRGPLRRSVAGVNIDGFIEVSTFILEWQTGLVGAVVGRTTLSRACEVDRTHTPAAPIPTELRIVPCSLMSQQIDSK